MLTSSGDYDVQAGTVGVILGGGATIDVNKTGAGTAILSAANTFSGSVTINGGVLSVSSLTANGIASNLGAGTSLAINGGTLRYTGGANTAFNRSITLGAGGGVIDQSGSDYLISNGVISGAGALTKIGAAN